MYPLKQQEIDYADDLFIVSRSKKKEVSNFHKLVEITRKVKQQNEINVGLPTFDAMATDLNKNEEN